MDGELLKIVGTIAGIGGISLGVLYLLLKEIIRKKIFPTLTNNHAYSILRLIIVVICGVSFVGIIAWAFLQYIEYQKNSNTLNASDFAASNITEELKLTDIIISQPEPGSKKLDFRVLNNSNKTITISRVKFKTVKCVDLTEPDNKSHSYAPVNATYNFNLTDIRTPYSEKDVYVSHTLKPGDSDRFEILIGMQGISFYDEYEWIIQIDLFTSEGYINGKEISFIMP